jgi:hypothetical protein
MEFGHFLAPNSQAHGGLAAPAHALSHNSQDLGFAHSTHAIAHVEAPGNVCITGPAVLSGPY